MNTLAYPLLLGTGVFLATASSGRMRLVFIVLAGAIALGWLTLLLQKASRHPDARAPFQSLAFLAGQLLAWTALGGFGTTIPFLIRALLGAFLFLLALSLLGSGPRAAGLRPPLAHGDAASLLRRRTLFGAGLGAALLGGIFLLLADPLPRASRVVLDAGEGIRELASPLVDAVTRIFKEKEPGGDDPTEMRGSGAPTQPGETRALPLRADIRQGDDLEVFLRIPDPADFARVVEGNPYVRSTVMNRFTGDGWQLAEGEERLVADADDGKRDGMVNLRPWVTAGIPHEVFVKNSSASALPALQGVVALGFDNVLERAEGWYVAGVQGDVHYRAVSAPFSLEKLPARAPLKAAPAPPTYLEVPENLRGRLRDLLAGVVAGGRDLRGRLEALSAYCTANFEYSLKVENPDGLPPMENFLFHEKRGYCDLFATAGVLLCREMGVPARIAYGHAGGESFAAEGTLSFTSRSGHSWTEIYLEDFGWVIYDLTPKSAGRSVPRPGEASRAPDRDSFRDARLREEPEAEPAPVASWLERIPAKAIYAILALLILAWALVTGASRLFGKGEEKDERRRRSRRARDPRSHGSGFAYPEYFLDFRKLCRALGIRDDEGHTLRDLLRTLRGAGIDASPFEEMTSYHYATRYEAAPRDTHREKEFRRQIRRYWKEGGGA